MFDILEGLFGSIEGGGFFEFLFNLVGFGLNGGGAVEGLAGHGSAFESVLNTTARAGYVAEGGFARLFSILGEGFNNYTNYIIWKDYAGGGRNGDWKDFESAWERMDPGSKTSLESLGDVVKGHAFMLKQLEAHQNKEGIAEIFEEYKKLGPLLPNEELVKKTYRALAVHLNSDQGINADDSVKAASASAKQEMFKMLNNARDALKDSSKRQAYEGALESNRQGVEEMFANIGKMFSGNHREANLFLNPPNYSGARKWLSELTPNQRGALIFASIVAIGTGTYLGVKLLEKRREKRQQNLLEAPSGLHTDRLREEPTPRQTSL